MNLTKSQIRTIEVWLDHYYESTGVTSGEALYQSDKGQEEGLELLANILDLLYE